VAESRTLSHPTYDDMRVPLVSQWLHLRESFGNLSVAWEQIPSTAAALRSERVTDEDGLTADDWLANEG
jgi:hypothetical protein